MESRANLFQTDAAFDKKAVVNRRVANDTRGYISELLAKAVTQGTGLSIAWQSVPYLEGG